MSSIETFFLPKETQVTFTPDAVASGHFVVLDGANNSSGFTELSAGTPVTVAATNEHRKYKLTIDSGSITTEFAFDGMADLRLDAVDSDLQPLITPGVNIAVVPTGVSADVEANADAINDILALLEAAGLMQAPA